jgi:N6-L-threonylcarbamoyladenine synthase
MLVLGIESSCDECAAAVVHNGRLLAHRLASQISIHLPFGGVVPELASRDHVRQIYPVIEGCLKEAGIELSQIEGVGVTAGPGLIGSLLIGVTAAKILAWGLERPLVGVNHLEAHLRAIFLQQPDFPYPHVGLVVSGGHTSIYRVDGIDQLTLLGRTLDDAAGEAFDKVAKLLGLSYPGGVSIQTAAETGDPDAIAFPRPMPGNRLDSSFSGLKTAAVVMLKKSGDLSQQGLADFAASFQEAVVDTLVRKTFLAATQQNLKRILVAGGVAANKRLRQKLRQKAGQEGFQVELPSLELCTDNAAMVAALSEVYLECGADHRAHLDANTS